MPNKRIFYAVQQVTIKPDGGASVPVALHGIQSCGMTTNFNLTQVFELGQISLYENSEDLPDIEISLTKALDGYPLIYHRATEGSASYPSTSPTLAGRSNAKAIFGLSIYPDTNQSATGTAVGQVQCSGLFVASVGYNFTLTEASTEDVRLVGNHKVWAIDPKYSASPAITATGFFTSNADIPMSVSSGVGRRQHILFTKNAGITTLDSNGMVADYDITVLPPEVFGISNSGTNNADADGVLGAHISSLSVNVDLGRESINELGRRGPYHRFAQFPVEVTCEVQVTSISGDMISATEDGIYTTGTDPCAGKLGNLKNRTIRIATCEGTRIYLGLKNRLSAVNYSGGDAQGGNVNVSYTFKTFNDFTVMHINDPNTSNWTWASRTGYLIN